MAGMEYYVYNSSGAVQGLLPMSARFGTACRSGSRPDHRFWPYNCLQTGLCMLMHAIGADCNPAMACAAEQQRSLPSLFVVRSAQPTCCS